MPHEPGHKYQIYGSSLEYTGKVVKIGEDLFTTNGGGFEGTSQKVTEVQMDNTQTITTTTQQAMDPLNQTNLKATKGQFRFRNGGPVPQGFSYHLHEGQAMEGAAHNPSITGGKKGHRFLDRVNENSTQRMTRANVNTSRVTPTTTTRSGGSGGGSTGGRTGGGMGGY